MIHTQKKLKNMLVIVLWLIDDLEFIAYISIINEQKKTELPLNMKVYFG